MTDTITALDLPAAELSAQTQKYFDVCRERLGMVPNVLQAYTFDEAKLTAFTAMYNDLMLADSGLSKLEREMIAVVVSSINKCYYCLTAHGAAVRQLSGRQRAMLLFAEKMTEQPAKIEEADRQALRAAGFTDRDIFDIASTTGFFNMTNRVATGIDMRPNPEYSSQAR